MAFDWNIFRIVADLYALKKPGVSMQKLTITSSHFVSKCILIWSIHINKSAEGVSLITQLWYLIVFMARYLPQPLLVEYPHDTGFHRFWNFSFKIFYLLSTAYTIFIMMRVYARTREREQAWKLGGGAMVGSLLVAPFAMLIFEKKTRWAFWNFSWIFSIILESVAVLPQLLLLRQTQVPTVIDSFYLATLGAYRGFYILNWIVRGAQHKKIDSPISVIFGVLQTLLYIDFAWVYLTRQRVKLRGGTVVDSEDLSKGWLVSRLLGKRGSSADEEDGPAFNHHDGADDNRSKVASQRWGPRGISVSADETTHEAERDRLNDPQEFEDDASDNEQHQKRTDGLVAPVGNGSEWRDRET